MASLVMTRGPSRPITAARRWAGAEWEGKEASRAETSVVGKASGCGCEAPESKHCNMAEFAETAVNIGFACQLLSENMLILEDKDIK